MSTLKTTNIAHPSSASNNIVLDSSGNVVLQAGTAAAPALQPSGDTNTGVLFPAADTVAISTGGSERSRVDSSGRLLVGTSTSVAVGGVEHRQQIAGSSRPLSMMFNGANADGPYLSLGKSRNATYGSFTVLNNNDELGGIAFQGDDGTDYATPGAYIQAFVDGTPGANNMPGRIVLSTTPSGSASPTERQRINNAGASLFFSSADGIRSAVSASAGTSTAIFWGRHSATSTSNGTDSFFVWSNGNVQNTNNSYGAISDIKLKENIVDATSQWDDIKALQVRNYNFKEGQTHTQIGLIAQEVELVSPGLVSESPDRDADGNDLGTVTKSVNYSVLYMKAVKALQEAMERIETLEASNTDLLARVSALESA